MRYAQLVIGPAGSGKVIFHEANTIKLWFGNVNFQSTYCSTIVRHCETLKRFVQVVNLDPAAEKFDYPCEIGAS